MKYALSLILSVLFMSIMNNGFAQDSIVKPVYDKPFIYFGKSRVGEVCSKDSKILSIRNDEDSIMTNYDILSFRLTINKLSEIYQTSGAVLSKKMQSVLMKLNQGDILFFSIRVNGLDGIARLIGCSFTIE